MRRIWSPGDTAALITRMRAHAHVRRWEHLPMLPTIANPDRDGAHEVQLDLEHLAQLSAAIIGEAGRLAADDPDRAQRVFAAILADLAPQAVL